MPQFLLIAVLRCMEKAHARRAATGSKNMCLGSAAVCYNIGI